MSCDSAGVDFIMSKAVREAYKLGEDDETLKPLVLVDMMGKPMGRIETGDYIIFYDIRGEREIELTSSFTDPDRVGFRTKEGLKVNFVTMIQYDEGLQTKVAFPPPTEIADTLSQVLGRNGLRQAKVVESEKAAHLTFFFNGRSRQTAPLEERVIVPSLEVRRADDRPEMNISEVAREIVSRINDPGYNVIIASFANVDVVGHIENRQAIIRAVEAVDHYTGMVVGAAIKAGVTAIITADHGTVEEWLYPDGTTDTGHTDSPVPFILIDPDPSYASKVVLRKKGELADVAPTMLEVLGLPKPRAMAGQSLLLSPPQIAYCRRVLLLILDGWGINHKCEGNLIAQASTPVMEHLQAYPFALLS
ncbi:MAG: phosphoglycerate mutase (2,3-diphosphoglycerate-independent), partial [Dehalococcoidia bacterium]